MVEDSEIYVLPINKEIPGENGWRIQRVSYDDDVRSGNVAKVTFYNDGTGSYARANFNLASQEFQNDVPVAFYKEKPHVVRGLADSITEAVAQDKKARALASVTKMAAG